MISHSRLRRANRPPFFGAKKMYFDYDFSFGLDDIDAPAGGADIHALMKNLESKSKKLFTIEDERHELMRTIKRLPSESECYKMISIKGGFSSIALIKAVAELEGIEVLYASTFRIGRKQIKEMDSLAEQGLIEKAVFITSTAQKELDTAYDYYSDVSQVCHDRGWTLKTIENHSKLILMKTKNDNYYVVETSSNLNENPKIEHYSFENSKELFDWYEEFFKELVELD